MSALITEGRALKKPISVPSNPDTAVGALAHHRRPLLSAILLIFLVFVPMNATVLHNPVVTAGKLAGTGLLLLALFFEFCNGLPARQKGSFPTPGATVALAAYCLLIFFSSLANHHGLHDIQQFLVMPMSAVALWYCEQRNRGSYFRILLTASVLHLFIAVILNKREIGTAGSARLTGGTHPIQLGLEAGLVLVYCLSRLLAGKRTVPLALGGFAVYIMAASLSKTAILGTMIAVLLQLLFYRRDHFFERLVLVLTGATIVMAFTFTALMRKLLGADASASDLTSATGRTTIWQHIFEFFPQYAAYGYGYPALHELGLRDNDLLILTHGEPAENAFIAALLMAGVGGLVLFAIITLLAGRDALAVTWRTSGFSLAAFVIVIASTMFSESASGLNYMWYWVLGMASLRGAANAPGGDWPADRLRPSTPLNSDQPGVEQSAAHHHEETSHGIF